MERRACRKKNVVCFLVDRMTREQVEEFARRQGVSLSEALRILVRKGIDMLESERQK